VRLKHYEDNKLVRIEDGELQLTNYGISGICVMQLSSMIVEGLSKNREEVIQINFLNGLMIDESNIRNWLVNRDEELNENISSLLVGVLNDKLIKVLLKMIKIRDMKYRDLSLEDKSKLEEVLVSLKVKITGSKGFMNAQVTRGGVCLKEIDLKTMEVKKMKNLYLAGEVVDVDGDCGGYNLTWAFISGLKASKGINND
jgi:predicted Rossmann fold flavoprotein